MPIACKLLWNWIYPVQILCAVLHLSPMLYITVHGKVALTLLIDFVLNDWSRHFFCSPISFKKDYPWISLPLLCLSRMADSIQSLTVVIKTQLFLSHAHLARNSVLVVSRIESQFCVTSYWSSLVLIPFIRENRWFAACSKVEQ